MDITKTAVSNYVTVGYLPAEHIETPTERLARLNKHRNIDVCPVVFILLQSANLHSSRPQC